MVGKMRIQYAVTASMPEHPARKRSTWATKTVLLGVLLVAAACLAIPALTRREHKPIGRLSSDDVRQIRALLIEDSASWNYFTRANWRNWPGLARVRFMFHIVEMHEEPISRVTTWPDGIREEPTHPVTVRFKAKGLQEMMSRVERKKGRWVVAPRTSEPHEVLLLPLDPPPAYVPMNLWVLKKTKAH
jgi:hypothetical protein